MIMYHLFASNNYQINVGFAIGPIDWFGLGQFQN